METRPRVSIVIPTLNEGATIGGLIQDFDVMGQGGDVPVELIIVDDRSTDMTQEAVRVAMQTRPWVSLIVRDGAPDLSRAVVEGWRSARGEWLGAMDGDLQHPTEIWSRILEEMRRGEADLVMGSRFVQGSTIEGLGHSRTVVSKTVIEFAHLMLGPAMPRLKDPMTGLFAVKRELVDLEKLRPRGYKILLEAIVRCGIRRIRELPFEFRSRKGGTSKAGPRVLVQYVLQVLALSWAKGRWWLIPLFVLGLLILLRGILTAFV